MGDHRGADCARPVILVVHGGPGNPLTLYADALFGAWQERFTVVNWDQRLAGRTYARNEPVTELTEERLESTPLSLERMVADGIEVAEYLRQRLGKREIILTGTSWGSVLAVHMAHRRADLFHAYIGVSRIVSSRDNEAASYAATVDMARRRQDAQAIATLEQIGPPPWKNPRNFGRLRRIIRDYEAQLTTPGPALRPASTCRHSDPAAQLPMYFMQGAEDLLTRPAITGAFFDSLDASRKKLIMVPAAGHDPNLAMLDAQFRLLEDQVLPLVH